ncbi:MAG: SHOCT domain-containing protein [Bdellovibrio sp.]
MGLWWILVIVAVVLAISFVNRRGFQSMQQKTALDILKERYARGEISKSDFENMKKDVS